MTLPDDVGTATDGTPTQTPATGDAAAQGDGGDWREQNTRLRQELAEQKELNRRAVPLVQVALQLQEQDADVYTKLLKGEKLTKPQAAAVEEAAEAAGVTPEVLGRMLDERFQQLTQQQSADRQAADAMVELDTWATEKLPGYENLRGTPTWNGTLSAVLGSIENGTMTVPPDVKDPYKWAVEETYHIISARNPDVVKGPKKVAQTGDDRAAAILAAGRKPSASQGGDELDGLTDAEKREIEFIRGIGSGVGKRFSP